LLNKERIVDFKGDPYLKKVLTFLFFLSVFTLQSQAKADEIQAEYVVLFKHEINWSLLERENVKVVKSYDNIPAVSISTTANIADKLKKSTDVQTLTDSNPYVVQAQQIPWGFEPLKAATEPNSFHTGKNVKVAIIDTGVDSNHPDLKVAGGVCVLDVQCKGNYQDDSYDGHGSHVAGTIAAQNNSIGSIGIAPGVSLYAVKALDSNGDGTTTTILSGIDWAIKNKMDIINLSLTTDSDDPILKAMVNKAYDNGILIVAAAGNNGMKDPNKDIVLYPAKYDSVIAVGGVKSSLKRMISSATGSEIEVVAPGEEVFSTVPRSGDLEDGAVDGYTKLSGTSMASPYVVGVLALLKEEYPNESNIELRKRLDDGARDLGTTGRDWSYGYGLVQVPTFDAPLPTGNQIKLSFISKGSVQFDLSRTTNIKGIYVKRSDQGDVYEVKDSRWTDYLPAGNYTYFFKVVDNNGNHYYKKITVDITEPKIPDVNSSDWFSREMTYLFDKSILKGSADNALRPSANISRAEAMTMIGRAIGLDETKRMTRFKDVSGESFAAGYIQSAFEKGIIKGFPNGTFRPDQPVTRAEMAILVSKAYNLTGDTSEKIVDISNQVTGYAQIKALYNVGITKGYPDHSFKPYKPINRAEYSVFLARAENSLFIK
jgi:hypothetical protein